MNDDNPKVATKWDQFRWRWLKADSAENILYEFLSEKWCGNRMAPIHHRTLRFTGNSGCDEVACVLNDSFDLGLGYLDKWHVIYLRADFHRIIRWYLWQWAFGEWFGVRRWLWFKLLNRRVERHRRHDPIRETVSS